MDLILLENLLKMAIKNFNLQSLITSMKFCTWHTKVVTNNRTSYTQWSHYKIILEVCCSTNNPTDCPILENDWYLLKLNADIRYTILFIFSFILKSLL